MVALGTCPICSEPVTMKDSWVFKPTDKGAIFTHYFCDNPKLKGTP